MLQADIDKLNELAQKLEQNGKAVDDLDIRTRPSPSLPGVEIGQSFAELAEKTEGAYLRIADRMRAVAGATRACANDLSMTDEGFAARMNELDFKPAQS
ncbi:hypothetical protein ACIBEK_19390 [Nocardia fusca]|uniref:hypothetical protein n=1 Tax=Nocardia TaxID=1817 RepID=UPI0033CA0651